MVNTLLDLKHNMEHEEVNSQASASASQLDNVNNLSADNQADQSENKTKDKDDSNPSNKDLDQKSQSNGIIVTKSDQETSQEKKDAQTPAPDVPFSLSISTEPSRLAKLKSEEVKYALKELGLDHETLTNWDYDKTLKWLEAKIGRQSWFAKSHAMRIRELEESIEEGYFEYPPEPTETVESFQQDLHLFYQKYVDGYGNEQLYQLWGKYLTILGCASKKFASKKVTSKKGRPEECVDSFYEALLSYIGFSDPISNLRVVNQFQIKLSQEYRADIAAGINQNTKMQLSKIFIFMENKKFENRCSCKPDGENTIKIQALGQLVQGAMQALHDRRQYDESVFLFRAIGGCIQIYKCRLHLEHNKDAWKKKQCELFEFGSELHIFNNKEHFVKFVCILKKLLLYVASVNHLTHPKIVSRNNSVNS